MSTCSAVKNTIPNKPTQLDIVGKIGTEVH